MKHISLDLETLSTEPHALVLSIGAVKFDLDLPGTGEEFHILLDQEEQKRSGRHVSPSTLQWWSEQSQEARDAIWGDDVTHAAVVDGLIQFKEFCKGSEHIWGNGVGFDNVILRSLFSYFTLEFPAAYWSDRDLRTLQHLSGIERPAWTGGVAHNALDDARFQAQCAQAYYGAMQRVRDAA